MSGPGSHAWQALMDSANDAYVAIDAGGVVTQWNRRATELFGWSRVEAVGAVLAEMIVPPEYRDAHLLGLQRFVAAGRGEAVFKRLELPALTRDGARIDVSFTILPARSPTGEWQFHAFLHNVTAARREQRYLRLLERVALAANEATTVEAAMRTALDEVRDVSGSSLAHAFLVAEDRLTATGWWSPTVDGPLQEATRVRVFDRGQGLPGRVAATGRPAWIPDVRQDQDFPRVDAAMASGVVAAFSFPITVQGRTVAVIELFRDRPSEPEDELLHVMETVGRQLGRVFEREQALDDLRALAEDREAIVAIVGHELRGPLAAAHTATGLLAEDLAAHDVPTGSDLLELLDRQLARLRRLVEMFLTAQRLEAGSLQVNGQATAIAPVVAEVTADGGFEAVAVDVPAGLEARADPDHLAQMVWNLLANAARHGRPPVRVSAEEADGTVAILVRDAGAGVPPEVRPKLFERFGRGASSHGSGLGLSIVRGLARANGGDATYDPDGPEGHAFVVTLPST
ncbi:MAG: GAF domain-containing protein [Actinobacteria bacterium]|nr:GAF domain-containing protein [Actinomycetota bacterium]